MNTKKQAHDTEAQMAGIAFHFTIYHIPLIDIQILEIRRIS